MVSVNLDMALKLTRCENEELVSLKRPRPNKEREIISVNEIKKKYDMKKIKVIQIDSWFKDGNYMGFEFLLKGK